jgi:hypothetical protein
MLLARFRLTGQNPQLMPWSFAVPTAELLLQKLQEFGLIGDRL